MKALKWWSAVRNVPGAPQRLPDGEPTSDGPSLPPKAAPARESRPVRDLVVLSLFLHSAGTVEEMMSLLVQRAPEVAGAFAVYPLLVDRRREVLHARPLEGCDEPGLGRLMDALQADITEVELPLSLPTARQGVLEGGEVVLFDGLHELAEDVLGREGCDNAQKELDLRKVALVPMVIEGEPLGLLVFLFQHPEPELEVLELLAGHCALALKTLTALDEAARFGDIDQVTWIYDRSHLLRALEAELNRCRRYERSLSLALLDIDRFSEFNRAYGATLGDRLLRSVAMLLAEGVSDPEMVARLGADEFAVLLPETDRAAAVDMVSQMLDRVSRVNVFGGSGGPEPVNVSVAIACYPYDGTTSDDLLQAAAVGLEQAKREKVPAGHEAAGERGRSPHSPARQAEEGGSLA